MNTQRRIFSLSFPALALCAAFFGAPAQAGWWGSGTGVSGSGNVQKQERAVSGFSRIHTGLSAEVEIRQGATESVIVETDDNLQSLVETAVENGTLKIRSADKNRYPDTKNLKITVFLKNIDEVVLGGSGRIFSDKLDTPKLQLTIAGAGGMDVKALQTSSLKVSIGGSGSFTAAGSAQQIVGNIGGSGNLRMEKLEAQDVNISIGGSGQVQTWAKERLHLSIGGSGNVSYYGDPKVTKSIGGSGSVRRLGAAPL